MTKSQVYPLALEIKQKDSQLRGLPGDNIP